MNKFTYSIIIIIFILVAIVFGIYRKNQQRGPVIESQINPQKTTPNTSQPLVPPPNAVTPTRPVADPLNQASTRVTKKPFSIYITPKTSPVQPEKFMGYHTGTDFETFPSEANSNIPFYAICEGKILQKRTATGYGGVLVQACTINKQTVTVIYGHIKLSSISKNAGNNLMLGEQIGFLGQPPAETDGERKHLHLGIHKGSAVNILGYVQRQSDLSGWLDFQKL